MSATPGKQELAAVKSRASQFTIPSHNHNPQFQSQLTIQFQIIDLPFTSQFIISIIQDSQLGLQFTIQINTILIHNPNSQHFRCTNKCNKNIQNPDAFLFFFISIAARSLINQILKPIKPVFSPTRVRHLCQPLYFIIWETRDERMYRGIIQRSYMEILIVTGAILIQNSF